MACLFVRPCRYLVVVFWSAGTDHRCEPCRLVVVSLRGLSARDRRRSRRHRGNVGGKGFAMRGPPRARAVTRRGKDASTTTARQ